MQYLPEVKEGKLVTKTTKKKVFSNNFSKKRSAKARARKQWKEYYESIEFIKHI